MWTHLADVLALELRDELVEAVVIGLDASDIEELLDVRSRGGGVSTGLEEEVGSNVTHLILESALSSLSKSSR